VVRLVRGHLTGPTRRRVAGEQLVLGRHLGHDAPSCRAGASGYTQGHVKFALCDRPLRRVIISEMIRYRTLELAFWTAWRPETPASSSKITEISQVPLDTRSLRVDGHETSGSTAWRLAGPPGFPAARAWPPHPVGGLVTS
jgi:hypothetical protein